MGRETRRVSVLKKGESGTLRTTPATKTAPKKKRTEMNSGGQQGRKALVSFVICYNCGGKWHTMKSCSSASSRMSKKIKRKAEAGNKETKRIKIIDKDGFTKIVNTQRTSCPTPGQAPKTPTPELGIVELVSD